MPSFAVRNFGCRVNQAEAFAWADAFRARGLCLDGAWDRSDVVLVNSCTLTGRADRDVRKFIRTASPAINPAARIVVTGCLAERAPAEIAAMPNVVAVLPQSAKEGIAARLIEIAGWGECPRARAQARTRRRTRNGRRVPPPGFPEGPGWLRRPLHVLRHPLRPGEEPERRAEPRRRGSERPFRPRLPGDRAGRDPSVFLRGGPRAPHDPSRPPRGDWGPRRRPPGSG